MAVNHFLDRLEKRLQFEVATVPLAIDKKCRRTVYPATYAAGKIPPHTLGKGDAEFAAAHDKFWEHA